jgi:phosphate transport system permease protein
MSSSMLVQQTREEDRNKEYTRIVRRLHTNNRIATAILLLLAGIVTVIFIGVIVLLLVQGIIYLFNPAFYSTTSQGAGASIAPELFNTVYILILSEIFLVPISLAAAIYLVEYAQQGPLVTIIHFAAETLAGIPSIVLGLFGVIAFVVFFNLHLSRISGALTLLCLNLPVALRLFEQALVAVPRELREGGLALGATKWRVIRTVVIPSALPGIITGIILTAGRVIGETAALIFTAGTTNPQGVFTLNPFIPSDTLTIHLWYIKTQGAGSAGLSSAQATAIAAGSSTLLIIILFAINLASRGLGRLIERRLTAA